MAKTIIRETIIILLLCLAIILVLGVVLYNYVPSNKIVPQEVSYTQTEEVKKAIQESVDAENSQVILTYKIDETDLDNYEKQGDYNSGKANPFSSYQQEIGSVEENLSTSFYKGEPLTISFSSKYANDAIKSFSGEKVKISFTGEMKPFIIKDFDSDELLQLVLPVRTY